MNLPLTVRKSNEIYILGLSGSLSSTSTSKVTEALQNLLKPHVRVVIDLINLETATPAGISALIRFAKLVQALRGEMRICRPNRLVQKTIKMAYFSSLLKVYDSKEAAFESLYTSTREAAIPTEKESLSA